MIKTEELRHKNFPEQVRVIITFGMFDKVPTVNQLMELIEIADKNQSLYPGAWQFTIKPEKLESLYRAIEAMNKTEEEALEKETGEMQPCQPK